MSLLFIKNLLRNAFFLKLNTHKRIKIYLRRNCEPFAEKKNFCRVFIPSHKNKVGERKETKKLNKFLKHIFFARAYDYEPCFNHPKATLTANRLSSKPPRAHKNNSNIRARPRQYDL